MALCSMQVSEQERRSGIMPLLQEFQRPSARIGSLLLSHAPTLAHRSTDIISKTTEAGNEIFLFVDLHLQQTVSDAQREVRFKAMSNSVLALSGVVGEIQNAISEDIKNLLGN
jgi:hypothetical protein